MSVLQENRRILFFVKVGVSLVLVVSLVWIVDWEQAIQTIRQANRSLIGVSPLFWLTSLILSSFRWQLVLADSRVTFPLRQAYTGYLIGAFYGIFLPGVVGGDAIRIGLCVRQTMCKIGTATASVLLERISGVLALLSFLLGIALLFPTKWSSLAAFEPSLSVTKMAAIALIGIVAVLLGRRVWMRWLPKKNTGGVWTFIYSGVRTLSTLRGRTLGIIVILSALFQATRILGMFVLSRALGLTIPLTVFFAVIPLVYLATLFPISMGGLGVREGTLVLLLAQFGVATSDAVTLSFLIYSNQVFVGVLGGLVQLATTLSHKEIDSVAEGANSKSDAFSETNTR